MAGHGHAVAVHHQRRALREPPAAGGQGAVHDHVDPGAAGTLQIGLRGFQQPRGARTPPVAVHAGGGQPGGGQGLPIHAHAGVHTQRAGAEQGGQLPGQGGLVTQQQAPRRALQIGQGAGQPGLGIATGLGVKPHEAGIGSQGPCRRRHAAIVTHLA